MFDFLLDVISGYGTMALAVNPGQLSPALIISAAVAGLIYSHYMQPRHHLQHLLNTTLSLILTLSLFFNVFSSVSDKNLALIPVYVVLCIPRVALSNLCVNVSYLITTAILLYCLLPNNNPNNTPKDTDSLSLFLHVFFAVANDTSFYIADSTLQKSLISKSLKALIIVLLLTRHNPFLSPIHGAVTVYYSIALLFLSMMTAASWFSHLQFVLVFANQRMLLRMQHVFYAFLVAVAWTFPLHLSSLRVFVIIMYTFTDLFMKYF